MVANVVVIVSEQGYLLNLSSSRPKVSHDDISVKSNIPAVNIRHFKFEKKPPVWGLLSADELP